MEAGGLDMDSSKIHIKQDSIVYVWNPRAPPVKQSCKTVDQLARWKVKSNTKAFFWPPYKFYTSSLCPSVSVSLSLPFSHLFVLSLSLKYKYVLIPNHEADCLDSLFRKCEILSESKNFKSSLAVIAFKALHNLPPLQRQFPSCHVASSSHTTPPCSFVDKSYFPFLHTQPT